MAIICLLFPALVFCHTRHKINGRKFERNFENILNYIFEFLCSTTFINVVIICIRMAVRQKAGNLYASLNQYSDLAVKYLLLGLFLAILVPYMEKFCRNKIEIKFEIKNGKPSISHNCIKVMVILFVVVMAAHHFIRLFDNAFWGDEGLAILFARKNWSDMLRSVAQNGHSPFHYAFVWLFCRILGESGFVYHLASTLPYFLVILVTLTLVWKWFGTKAMLILTAFDTFLASAVIYNLEVRMYAWCQLFIFLAYLMAYKIYETRRNKYFVLMALCSLGAVYSHYFALATIGLLYLILLIYFVRTERKNVWKAIISGCSVLLCFIPWLVFCYRIAGSVMLNYKIVEIEWYDCFEFLFHSRYSMVLLYAFFIFWSLHLIYEIGIIRIRNKENKKISVSILPSPKDWTVNGYVIWTVSGVCAVFGTIIVSKIISSLVFPIIVLRYLYPSYIIIWLLFGISISKCRFSKLYTLTLLVTIFVSCYPNYCNVVKTEQECNKRLENTLAKTMPEIGENDFIYTNIGHLGWTVGEVYYPGVPVAVFDQVKKETPAELPRLGSSKTYWLFLSDPITEKITANLTAQKRIAELVVDHGYIGTGDVWIYKVDKNNGKVTK